MQGYRRSLKMDGIIELAIKLKPLNSFYIPSWPGVFAAKIFYDAASSAGLKFSKIEEKAFSLTPIKPEGMSEYYMAGVYKSKDEKSWRWLYVNEADILLFNVYLFSKDSASKLVSELNRNPVIMEPCGKLELAGIEGKLITIGQVKEKSADSEWINLRLTVEYLTPTRFMMRGLCLDYPSHVRFLKSLGKSYHVLTGSEDVRYFIDKLTLLQIEYEKTGDKTVQCYVDIGHEDRIRRFIRAFYGEANYILHIRECEVEALQQLLKLGEVVGVGVNRGLGLGRIKTRLTALPD